LINFVASNSLCLSSIMISHYTTNIWLCHYIAAFSIAPSRLYHRVLDCVSLSQNAFLLYQNRSFLLPPQSTNQNRLFCTKTPEICDQSVGTIGRKLPGFWLPNFASLECARQERTSMKNNLITVSIHLCAHKIYELLRVKSISISEEISRQ
jgi:hypothetical protein